MPATECLTTLQMMSSVGWVHDEVMRMAISRLVAFPTHTAYQLTQMLVALRKIDITAMYSDDEITVIVQTLCGKIRKMHAARPLSSRLIASTLTSLNSLNRPDVALMQEVLPTLIIESKHMDAITVSAVLVSCARVSFKDIALLGPLIDRCGAIDWSRSPIQAIHVLYAAAVLIGVDEKIGEFLVFLGHNKAAAMAMRTVLDTLATYRMLCDAVALVNMSGNGSWILTCPVGQIATQ